jgi:hypothetical protein
MEPYNLREIQESCKNLGSVGNFQQAGSLEKDLRARMAPPRLRLVWADSADCSSLLSSALLFSATAAGRSCGCTPNAETSHPSSSSRPDGTAPPSSRAPTYQAFVRRAVCGASTAMLCPCPLEKLGDLVVAGGDHPAAMTTATATAT